MASCLAARTAKHRSHEPPPCFALGFPVGARHAVNIPFPGFAVTDGSFDASFVSIDNKPTERNHDRPSTQTSAKLKNCTAKLKNYM